MRWSILILSAVLLVACGQAGSLYLPVEPNEPAPAEQQPADATTPAADEAEARKRQSDTPPDTPAQ